MSPEQPPHVTAAAAGSASLEILSERLRLRRFQASDLPAFGPTAATRTSPAHLNIGHRLRPASADAVAVGRAQDVKAFADRS